MGSCPTVNTCKHSSLQLFPQRIYQPTNLHSKREKVHAKQPFSHAFLGNTIALQIETLTTQIHEPQWLRKMVAQGFGGSRWWLLIHVPHLLWMWKILVVVYIYIYNKTRVAWEGLQFLTQSMGCPENHLGLSFAFLGVMKSKLFLFVCLHRFTEKVYKMVGAPLRSN